MPRSLMRPLALAALLGLLLAPWSAAAAGPSHSTKRPQVLEVRPLSVLLGSLLRFLTKEGCMIDPDGLLTPPADEGCGLDPSGHCTAATADAGCGLDPNGCASGN
jgi:hypothetical protein